MQLLYNNETGQLSTIFNYTNGIQVLMCGGVAEVTQNGIMVPGYSEELSNSLLNNDDEDIAAILMELSGFVDAK